MNSGAFSNGYADAAAAPSNMLLLNSATSNSANPIDHQPQHLVGAVPLQPAAPLPHNLWSAPFLTATARLGTLSLSLSEHDEVAVATHMTPVITEQGKSFASFFVGSKYLKAAQRLLDELVNVCERIKDVKIGKGATSKNPAAEADGVGNVAAVVANLTAAERQELQMKKEKLADMLKELEERYMQYRQQMQVVVSSLEAIAGYGSSRAYTLLALRTISKHFRCLRDAISGQVRASGRSLGEEDDKCRGSKLRFIDRHFRQQQALQQLGMMQHNSWRPQRGLPEHSVSILRAWLLDPPSISKGFRQTYPSQTNRTHKEPGVKLVYKR